jgi:ELWxxDGT repeat protein
MKKFFILVSSLVMASPKILKAQLTMSQLNFPNTFPYAFAFPVVAQDKFYYASEIPGKGSELVYSDLDLANPVNPKDIWPGQGSSSPKNITPIGSKVVFTAENGIDGRELYVSDGTNAGTFQLANFTLGSASTFGTYTMAEAFGDYSLIVDDFRGGALYVTDGTVSGTKVVKKSGSECLLYSTAGMPIVYIDSWGQDSLCLYNRSQNRLDFLTTMGSGSWSLPYGDRPKNYAKAGNKFVLGFGSRVLISNGTQAGSTMLTQIGGQSFSNATDFTVMGNMIYFTATTTSFGNEVYVIDLQNNTAQLAANINLMSNGSGSSNPSNLTAFQDTLFVIADDGFYGRELHKIKGNSLTSLPELVTGFGGLSDYVLDSVQNRLIINSAYSNSCYFYQNGKISLSGRKFYPWHNGSTIYKSTALNKVENWDGTLAVLKRNNFSTTDSLVLLQPDGGFLYISPATTFSPSTWNYYSIKIGNSIFLPTGFTGSIWRVDGINVSIQSLVSERKEEGLFFPNPSADGQIRFTDQFPLANISITDQMGKVVKQISKLEPGEILDFYGFKRGIYFIYAHNRSKFRTYKIILN